MGSLLHAQTSSQEESNRIYWHEDLRINWGDFQGPPQESKTTAALSSIAIPYSFEARRSGELKVRLRVCFEKDKSWSKKEKQHDLLLAHEQLHFDIAELHRRKLVKALKESNLNESNYKERVEDIVFEYWNGKYRQMQDYYDKETDFSKNEGKQEEWRRKVNRLLKRYDRYKEEEFLVYF